MSPNLVDVWSTLGLRFREAKVLPLQPRAPGALRYDALKRAAARTAASAVIQWRARERMAQEVEGDAMRPFCSGLRRCRRRDAGPLDAIWLSTMAGRLYRPQLGDLLAPDFRVAPARAFTRSMFSARFILPRRRRCGTGAGDGRRSTALCSASSPMEPMI